ncbi:MAG: hypothetical protein GY865_04250, partial [candidate division Zixibacteria bacterium]|nr:hypothetical protein [candidate division Zixibacteria bacterium]
PLFYVGHGQSLLTDPYHLTHSARNEILFDDWNQYDYHRWDVFKNSLISGVSYLFFSVFGVSRISANIASISLHLAGMLLFIFGLYRTRCKKEILFTALFLLINATFFYYGRLPYLENGLIFLSGLTFYIFVKYNDKIWGQALTGGLIVLAALAGKLFGFILIGPVFLILIYRYRAKFIKPVLITLGGMIASAFLYIYIFYSNNLALLNNYYAEQTTGMYGSPPGFSSVIAFLKMLIIYGGESGLVDFAPFIILLIVLSLILINFVVPYTGKFDKDLVPIIFCVGWLLAGVLGLMPFYYRPIRYALFLFIPGAAICGFALNYVIFNKIKLSLHNRYISLPLLFFFLWYISTQVFIFFAPFGQKSIVGVKAMPMTALFALAVVAILFFAFFKKRSYITGKWPAIIFGFIILAICLNQGQYFYKGLTESGQLLKQYNNEFAQMIDKDAVLTGPYAPALSIENDLKSVIYVFGLANIEKNLFERFPITHIVSDRHNWQRAIKDFPFLKSSLLVVQTVIRNQVISLYRIPTAKVPGTYFETAQNYFRRDIFDSALVHFQKFSKQHPENLLGQIHLVLALSANGEIEKSRQIMNQLLAEHPDNYMLHGFCVGYYKRLSAVTGDNSYLQLSEYHGNIAQKRVPGIAIAN